MLMKLKLTLLCLLFFMAYTQGLCQGTMPGYLKVKTISKDFVSVNMYDQECIHVVDGLITSYKDSIPQQDIAHFEKAASREKLAKLGFKAGQCVMVKSSVDLEIENYVYRQVHGQVQKIGNQYKIPIAVNGKLRHAYKERRSQLSKLKVEAIKEVKFLNKAAAQEKYGDKVVFGLIEIVI